MKKIIILLFIVLLTLTVIIFTSTTKKVNKQKESVKRDIEQNTREPEKEASEPISNAKTRITKKPFGLFVTPFNSPVQPEKFTGYHTGTDFETNPEETNQDIQVSAICSGKICEKNIISGYGGVIIQDCFIENQPVTVLYGHLNITESMLNIGDPLNKGQKITFLAPAKSEMSGGERKHLHLGIHKGSLIDYRGYLNDKSELGSWFNIEFFL